jgi:hypothetical protein
VYVNGDSAADQYNTGGNQKLVAKDPVDSLVGNVVPS